MRRARSPTTSPSIVALRSRPSEGSQARPDDEPSGFEEQLHPAFFIVWVASLACVAGAFYRHEALGAEATLALMTAVALPWYAIAARARR